MKKWDRPYLCNWDPSRYRRAYLYGGQLESEVQSDVVDALTISKIDAEVIDAGAKTIRGKISRMCSSLGLPQPTIMRIMNSIKSVGAAETGRADLSGCLAPNGRAFFLEIKAPAKLDPVTGKVLRSAGHASDEQIAYLDKKHAEGAIVGIAFGIDDAFEILGTSNVLAHQQAIRGRAEYF